MDRKKTLLLSCALTLWLLPGAAAADVQCGDVIGPNQIVILTHDLTCGQLDIGDDTNCAVTLEGPNAQLYGGGHRLRCVDDGSLPDGVCINGRGNRLENLRVRNCQDGVEIDGDENVVEDVDTRGNAGDGIDTEDGSNDNTLRRIVTNRNGTGIEIEGSRNLLSSITANNNDDEGSGNPGDGVGIWLRSDSGGTPLENDLVNVTANRNSQEGLRIDGDARLNDIRNSTFNNNDEFGILVLGDDNWFTKVVTSGNGDDGFRINGNGEGNQATESDFSGNDDDGVDIRGDGNSVTDGEIEGDPRAVRLSGNSEDNTITGNVITGAILDLGTDNVTDPNP